MSLLNHTIHLERKGNDVCFFVMVVYNQEREGIDVAFKGNIIKVVNGSIYNKQEYNTTYNYLSRDTITIHKMLDVMLSTYLWCQCNANGTEVMHIIMHPNINLCYENQKNNNHYLNILISILKSNIIIIPMII